MNELQKKKHKSNNIPHSIETEQIVLGCIMTDPTTGVLVTTKITKRDFYRNEHKEIFTAITNLSIEQKQLNIVTITDYLEKKNKLTYVGGIVYLSELTNLVPKSFNIILYIEILKKKTILRESICIGNTLVNYCLNKKNKKTLTEMLYETEQNIQNLCKIQQKNNNQNKPISIAKILKKTILFIDRVSEINTSIIGIPTGFKDFDKLTTGLHPATLTIIAGRPSMGKTTFALNIIGNLLKISNKTIIFFSMEMQSKQIAVKLLSFLTKINIQNLCTGQLTELEWKIIATNISSIIKKKLYIDDSSTLSPMDIRIKIKKILQTTKKIDLIVIDYLQLIKLPINKKETRTFEISEISRTLKILAKDFNVPIIVLSQLNRNLEQRYDKRPIMADLRESGAIEQDADLIIFIYRDEIYNKNVKTKGLTEIIIGKQRNGPMGTIKLSFKGEYSRFENN